MKKILLLVAVLIPVAAFGYKDYRGHNLDSLEREAARFTPDRLANASDEDRKAYSIICRDLAWGYLQLDGVKTRYYAREAIKIARELGGRSTVFDMDILIGQCFWFEERYDSARVYYSDADRVLQSLEENWTNPDPHDLEAMQSRLWGTLGNFYAAQDSLEQFAYYYGKAGEIFEKWGWYEDCSTLHLNVGEFYTDNGDYQPAKPEYDLALKFARQSGDSLMIAKALYGLGRWYQEDGKTAKALEYLTEADEYFGNHAREEAYSRANMLAVMKDAYNQLYRNALMLAIGAGLLLLVVLAALLIAWRLKQTRQELSETAAVLEETIKEIRPVAEEAQVVLNEREKTIARLLAEGKSTKEIADAVCLGTNTILWYRKRLYAKLDVHSAAAFSTEAHHRHLL